MPSRRTVIHALGVGILPFTGCGERQPNSNTRTAGSETDTTTSTATRSPTPNSTTTGEQTQTPQDIRCSERWTQEDVWAFGSDLRTPIAAAGENAIFTVMETELVALDPETGNPVWRTPNDAITESFGAARLLAVRNRVLVVGHNHVAGLDAETGRPSWVFTAPGKPQTVSVLPESASILGGSVYVGVVNTDTPSFEAETPFSRIYAVDISTGESRTVHEFSSDTSRGPTPRYITGTETRLFCTVDDHLVALTVDGNIEWRRGPFDGGYPRVAHSTGVVLVSSGTALTAFDSANGRQLWEDSELSGRVAVDTGVGYATDGTTPAGDGQLTAFDPQTGTHYWEARTGGQTSTPAVDDGSVFVTVTTEDRTLLTAFDAERGCRFGSFELAGGDDPPVVGTGRVSVYSGSYHDWRLVSFSSP